jgi:CHAT domain-containing protein
VTRRRIEHSASAIYAAGSQGIKEIGSKWSYMMALGFDASLTKAMSPELSQYQILHFATHGIVNNEHPELSGIVLSLFNERGDSQNGFLRLPDIYKMNLNAELVVVSACRSGLGKTIRGEGMIG